MFPTGLDHAAAPVSWIGGTSAWRAVLPGNWFVPVVSRQIYKKKLGWETKKRASPWWNMFFWMVPQKLVWAGLCDCPTNKWTEGIGDCKYLFFLGCEYGSKCFMHCHYQMTWYMCIHMYNMYVYIYNTHTHIHIIYTSPQWYQVTIHISRPPVPGHPRCSPGPSMTILTPFFSPPGTSTVPAGLAKQGRFGFLQMKPLKIKSVLRSY